MRNIFAKDHIILDQDDFYTKDLFAAWYDLLRKISIKFLDGFLTYIGHNDGIRYIINPTLLREVVYDAIIGLKKITDSENNYVSKPNAFKIAAHLGYWFVRHKPIIFIQEKDFNIDDIKFPTDIQNDEEGRLVAIWQMKHMNEVIAAGFMFRYIFKFGKQKYKICDSSELKKVQDCRHFFFKDFEELTNVIIDKLTYHIAYRIISPEVLEHFLEGYTLHPVWDLTEDIWNTDEE